MNKFVIKGSYTYNVQKTIMASSKKEAQTKVCRINGKNTIKGGKTQLNLHDGRNILVDDATEYSTGDSLVLSLPSQEIKEHIRFAEGTKCYLTGGAHVGEFAEVSEYIVKRSSMPNEVQFGDFGTIMSNEDNKGARIIDILSPVPPVLCLSATYLPR